MAEVPVRMPSVERRKSPRPAPATSSFKSAPTSRSDGGRSYCMRYGPLSKASLRDLARSTTLLPHEKVWYLWAGEDFEGWCCPADGILTALRESRRRGTGAEVFAFVEVHR